MNQNLDELRALLERAGVGSVSIDCSTLRSLIALAEAGMGAGWRPIENGEIDASQD